MAQLELTNERRSCAFRLASGRRLGFAEFGDASGAPVLALHGTPGSRLMFDLADQPARERSLRLIAPERPGYGLSDPHRYESLAEAAADILALADALGLRRYALIGVSGGGPYAVAVAAADVSRLAMLALVSPVGPVAECGRDVPMTRMHRLIFKRLARSRRAASSFFWGLRKLVHRAPGAALRGLKLRVPASDRKLLGRPEVEESLRAAITEGLRHGVSGPVQDLRLYCGLWNLPLASITVPAFVWQGSDDTIVPRHAAERLAALLPNCRLEVLPGGGHYWVFGKFSSVLDEVAAALR